MIMFYVPEDENLLAILGEITLRHEHMNHILKMTIKSLANITPAQAIDALKYTGSAELRKRINKLAKNKLQEGQALLKLQAILTRAERLTEQRNKLIHGLWAQELNGESGLHNIPGEIEPIPSQDELKQLACDIKTLTEELNRERLEGFLKTALEEKLK